MRVCALTRCAPPTHVAWYGDSFAKLANLAAQTSEMEVVWVTGRAFAASKRMEVTFFIGLNLNLGKGAWTMSLKFAMTQSDCCLPCFPELADSELSDISRAFALRIIHHVMIKTLATCPTRGARRWRMSSMSLARP